MMALVNMAMTSRITAGQYFELNQGELGLYLGYISFGLIDMEIDEYLQMLKWLNF